MQPGRVTSHPQQKQQLRASSPPDDHVFVGGAGENPQPGEHPVSRWEESELR